MRPATKKRIRELGYKGYRGYLLSDHWKIRRSKYFATHPKVCWICGSTKDIHLHHVNYARIGAEWDRDLLPLCRSHHRGLHTYAKNKRMKIEVAHLRYKKFLQSRG